MHQRENNRVIPSAARAVIPLWAHNALYLIKTLSCSNQFTQKSPINYASSLWCLCTIDAFQILSDSDLIFWWAHQQPEITTLKTPKQRAKSSSPTSTASNAASLFRVPWHLTQFSNWSLRACAKIKPTHFKLHRLSQSTLQDCNRCTMTAVIWEDCSGQGMCKQLLMEEYAAQMHTPCYRRRWSHYLQQHLRSNSVHIIPW